MRLWSLHPQYLDAKGLVALWRESLLAQKVLAGQTKGYRHHPQLERFRNSRSPLTTMGVYLSFIVKEAERRGYRFDESKILRRSKARRSINLTVTNGQIAYEVEHLSQKLKVRDRKKYFALAQVRSVQLHPLFLQRRGRVEAWEKV